MASKRTAHDDRWLSLPNGNVDERSAYPNIFIDERSGMFSLGYLAALQEVGEAINAQPFSPSIAPASVANSADSLRVALAAEPRDYTIIRERAIRLAADSIGAIKAIGGTGELGSGYVSPTNQRLARLIEDYAPRVGDLTDTGADDALGRWGDEILSAVERYTTARPHTLSGTARGRVKSLYRIVALAAHGIAALSDR